MEKYSRRVEVADKQFGDGLTNLRDVFGTRWQPETKAKPPSHFHRSSAQRPRSAAGASTASTSTRTLTGILTLLLICAAFPSHFPFGPRGETITSAS